MRRYELNDEQWERIAGLIPEEGAVQGRPWRSHRQVFNGILRVLCSGAAWRDPSGAVRAMEDGLWALPALAGRWDVRTSARGLAVAT